MRSLGVSRDHPRSRGEYPEAVGRVPRRSGSSPLSRGIPHTPVRAGARVGIIPALAGNTSRKPAGTCCTRDHPRSRGEYPATSSPRWRRTGSSPLSRGIPSSRCSIRAARGIIPALAGNTLRTGTAVRRCTDHPRSRGEYYLQIHTLALVQGSSPLSRGIRLVGPPRPRRVGDHPRSRGEYSGAWRVSNGKVGSSPLSRGIRVSRYAVGLFSRIIPALAGNTHRDRLAGGAPGDHPRSRGEYWQSDESVHVGSGSSPLSRGIHRGLDRVASPLGIIPALAGNTFVFSSTAVWYADHPRSRGEYKLVITPHGRREGSSPLSRGILLTKNLRVTKIRIIPALAGNTHFWMSPSPWGWDHPRSRGEYLRDWDQGAPVIGSSPLSRGILQEPGSHLRNIRIIPALAGNTRPATPVSACTPDHPRSRGEYGDAAKSMMGAMGSSPLSRGIPRADHPILGPHRIIPALAGNTRAASRTRPGRTDHPRSRGEYLFQRSTVL